MELQLLRHLHALNQTTLDSVNAGSEEEIVSQFIRTIIRIVKADYGFSFFKDSETNKFKLLYKDPRTPFEPAVPRQSGATARAFVTGRPLYIQSYSKMSWARSHAKGFMEGVVVIPITYKTKNYGTLDICYRKTHLFTEPEKILCEYVGSIAAQAITIFRLNARQKKSKIELGNTVKRRTRELVAANDRLKKEIEVRKETEAKLSESQRFVQKVTNVLPGLIAVYNIKTGQYLYVNGALEQMLGYKKEEFLEKGIPFVSSLVHPEDLRKIMAQNAQAVQRAEQKKKDDVIEIFEYRIRHKNGFWKWINTYGLVFDRAADGSVKHILNISVDITDRKAVEESLRQRTRELETSQHSILEDRAQDEALLDSMGEGILATNSAGTITVINPVAATILGYEEREMLGKSLFGISLFDEQGKEVKTSSRPSYQALMKRKVATTSTTEALYYKRKDGGLVPVSLTATPVIFKNEVIGVIQVFRDISAEKEIDRAKSELISLASHQLRTPLSAINWYTEALLSGELGKFSKDQKKYLREIFQANQKMVELVYDFLNVSRMELGTFSVKFSDINLKELVESILQEIRPLIKQKNLKMSETYRGGVEGIRADRKIIRLILQNLITNAVKYTPPKGSISVSVRCNKISPRRAKLHIVVKDTGYGIPEHQQNKIFSKLFRGDNVLRLDAEGTGLGLYLVKSFVDFCKGKISFKSKENKGTTFTVTLPVELAGSSGKHK